MVDVLIRGVQGPTTNPRGDYDPTAAYYLADQVVSPEDLCTYQLMVAGPVTGILPGSAADTTGAWQLVVRGATVSVELGEMAETVAEQAEAVAAAREEVAAKTETVVEQSGQVAAAHEEVVTKTSIVVEKASEVAAAHEEVVTKTSIVVEKASEVDAAHQDVVTKTSAVVEKAGQVATNAAAVSANTSNAEAARVAAEAARDIAQSASVGIGFTRNTLAELQLITSAAQWATGQVLTGDDAGLYAWSGSAWEKKSVATVPGLNTALQTEVDERKELLKYDVNDSAGGIEIVDDYGFLLGRFKPAGGDFGGLVWSRDDAFHGQAYSDGAGFGSVSFDPHGATIAGLRFEADPQEPSVVYCDGRGFLLYRMGEVTAEEVVPEEAPDASPLFSSLLCGVTGEDLSIYARNLVPVRSDTDDIFGTIASTEALNRYSRTAQNELVLEPERLGASAQVSMRGADIDLRITRSVSVKVADKSPASPPTGKILMIGDSIVDRQGAFILKQQLEGWGYAPTFVGTLNGSTTASSAGDELGPLGEGRGGWLTGDYTYTSTSQAIPVAAGDEALYLSMSKSDKHDRNPFIRLATGSDAAEVIRNGYVMDFEFYCTRFGVDTPDIVLYNLGTNDIRDIAAGEIYDAIYANEMLTMARLRLAWPAAKIIRYLPGATRNVARDELWAQRYVPTIRAIMQAQKDLGDSKLYLAPTWAMVTSEVGYALASGTTDETTGAVTRTISDAVHPIGCARAQLYHAVAGYVACAMSGLI